MKFKVRWGFLLPVFLFLNNCVGMPHIPGDKNLLAPLLVPGCSREKILLALGEPSAGFEAGRIVTYRIGEDDEGYFLMDRMVRWSNTKYSLVLVFDDSGNLTRHNMVPVR